VGQEPAEVVIAIALKARVRVRVRKLNRIVHKPEVYYTFEDLKR